MKEGNSEPYKIGDRIETLTGYIDILEIRPMDRYLVQEYIQGKGRYMPACVLTYAEIKDVSDFYIKFKKFTEGGNS